MELPIEKVKLKNVPIGGIVFSPEDFYQERHCLGKLRFCMVIPTMLENFIGLITLQDGLYLDAPKEELAYSIVGGKIWIPDVIKPTIL